MQPPLAECMVTDKQCVRRVNTVNSSESSDVGTAFRYFDRIKQQVSRYFCNPGSCHNGEVNLQLHSSQHPALARLKLNCTDCT